VYGKRAGWLFWAFACLGLLAVAGAAVLTWIRPIDPVLDWLVLALPILAIICAVGMVGQGARLWDEVAEQDRLDRGRRESTERLRRARDDLEHRVAERSAELDATLVNLVDARHAAERANAELERANAQLEQRVAERTQQLADTVRELERAMAAAEEANRAKGDFLARMSHEIRTPLNGVLGMADLLLEGDATPAQRDLLRVVRASGEHLLELIDDVLDFARIEAGTLEINAAPFRLRDLVADLLKPLAVRAEAKRVELIADIGPEVADRLVGDAGRLRQVLVNLVGNAVKFTERGEVVVRVRLAERSAARDKVTLRFEVADTGIGIPADRQRLVFEPFVQADGSLARKYGGTGLGLSISSRLVALMGGTLDVVSEVGVGSTFQFAVALGHEGGSSHEALLSGPLAGARVLVVDDSASNWHALAEVLRGWGMIATHEVSVAGALRALRAAAECCEPFRVVVFDGALSPPPAGEWQRERAQVAGRCEVGVVLVSLAARRRESGAWREAASQAVCKPVRPADLFDAIQTALGLSRLASRGGSTDARAEAPLRPLRILLAEDNPFNQQVAVATLERDGHHVTVAGNGREALEWAERAAFDVVLMDVQMPEMDGLEAVRRLRERERTTGGRLSVVALTAHAMAGDAARCLDAGMDGYLTKPLDRAALRTELRRVTQATAWDLLLPPEPQTAETAPEVFCLAATLARSNGDRHLASDLAGMYRAESARILAEIDQALDRSDARTAARLAHTLRGSSGFFDAKRAVALAAELEKATDLDPMRATVAELRRAVEEVCAALEQAFAEVAV